MVSGLLHPDWAFFFETDASGLGYLLLETAVSYTHLTHKKVWLCRCLTLMLLLTVTVAGATGWAQALYLFSDGDGSAAVLDETHSGIDSVLLNLETGKSGENAMLTAGTLVTVQMCIRDRP